MGNKIARTTQASASEYYLHDLPSSYNLVLIELLGRGRFFKSILCKHDEGLVLVKVYFKRGEPFDLKEYEKKLREIREIFRNVQHSHLWPFQFWLETDKAAYLLRQYFFSNLHDRLSTRPFLSLIEKKWLAFQLLCAVKQSHESGVCHGDIKCENVLVTSWNWLYLTDFASFKPTYIPDDDPSDFSFFFDTGGRRRCYLAPERFYEHGGEAQVPPDSPLKPSMDIFSLGCVIAELFLEGQPLFELSQLLAYRRGQYDPRQCLEKIPDTEIQNMILHMIQLDPESRLSCESYLQEYSSVVFPCYFSPFLHKFFSCLTPLDSDTRVAVIQGAFQEIIKQLVGTNSSMKTTSKNMLMLNLGKDEVTNRTENVSQRNSFPTGAVGKRDLKKDTYTTHIEFVGEISHLLEEAEMQSAPHQISRKALDCILEETNAMLPSNFSSCLDRASNVQLNLPRSCNNRDHFLKGIQKEDLNSVVDGCNSRPDALLMSFFPDKHCTVEAEGMVLIASLICSCIRTVKQPQLRRAAVLLLMSSSLYIDDEDRLQHVIPYVIAMLSDTAAIVRCAALETLSNILPLVKEFPPSDAKIFPEYILPMLSMLPDDPEESVRICYARNIFKIALTAYRFLVSSEKSSEFAVLNRSLLPSKPPVASTEVPGKRPSGNFDSELTQLRKSISEVVHELVMGSKQTANIRRALLQDVGHLCYFFGQRQSNDVLLPILPAFLNDRDELLRADFYGKIIYVCLFVGQRSVEEYLLPYIEQGLNDDNEAVVVNALECLTVLCRSVYLRKRILLDMIEKAFSLLCYPILCVRRECVRFIAATAENLGPVDSYVYLSPVLRPFLYREPTPLCSETALLSSLKSPVSKQVYYKVLEQARSSDMLERQRKIWYNSSAFSNQEEDVENAKNIEGSLSLKTNSNKLQSIKLASAGLRNLTIADVGEGKPIGLEGTLGNISATTDGKERISSSNKLQFSGFVSPHVSDGANLLSDGPSEGIPLYSFSTDRYLSRPVSQWDNPSQQNSFAIRSLSNPWMGSVSKSFVLSSSEPAKLVSGSIYTINNSSKKSSLSQLDQDNKGNDQSSYITGKFHDVAASETFKGSSSIVAEDTQPHDGSGSASLTTVSSLPDAGWRPRGVLVAHLQEHRSAINDVAVSYDHSFFVSASDDSTVKIWDTRKLEKDISFRSRLTYPLDGSRALCTTMLHGNAQVLVGACDGTLHSFSVDYISRGLGNVVERYSGIAEIKKQQIGEGAILSILKCSAGDGSASRSVLFSTQGCGVHLWDTRTDSSGWKFKASPDSGYISSLVMGLCGNWFVSGTSRGVLTLWDMRFLLPVYSWKYSSVCPVEKMCLYIPPPKSTLSATGRPLIYVAAGCNELSLWNAENGSCHQVFRVAGCEGDAEITAKIPWALANSNKPGPKQVNKRSPKTSYRDDELDEPPPRLPGIRALLPLPGGDLLTGGTDLRIRYLDHSSPGRSFNICGPSTKGLAPEDLYETRSILGVQVVQEVNRRPTTTNWTQKALLAVAATDSAGSHHDSILSLASVKLNQRLLISSSRDGAIKVWK